MPERETTRQPLGPAAQALLPPRHLQAPTDAPALTGLAWLAKTLKLVLDPAARARMLLPLRPGRLGDGRRRPPPEGLSLPPHAAPTLPPVTCEDEGGPVVRRQSCV